MTALLVYLLGVTFVLWCEDEATVSYFAVALIWPLLPVLYLALALNGLRKSR